MKKMHFLIIYVVIIFSIVIGVTVYLKNNHYVEARFVDSFEEKGTEDFYEILYDTKELSHFEEEYGISIQMPKKFDFKKEAVLICSGHELIEAYYNISDEDDKLSSTHFLYVVMNKRKENKIFVYSIPNNYNNWFYSQRYYDGFNGIEYRDVE